MNAEAAGVVGPAQKKEEVALVEGRDLLDLDHRLVWADG